MTPHDVAERLAAVRPAELAAPALLVRLMDLERRGQLSEGLLAGAQSEIEAALKQIGAHIDAARKVASRCKALPAIPNKSTPLGF